VWLAVVIETITAAVHHLWFWVFAGVVGVLYIGLVGTRLHPTLSASQMRAGPTESEPAIQEMAAMSRDERLTLIAAALNRLIPVLATLLAANLLVLATWKWYVAIPVAFIGAMLLTGVIGGMFGKSLKRHGDI
jgi:uncharacterized protein YneF (UPF0154 family)